jgi:hypothetical protein
MPKPRRAGGSGERARPVSVQSSTSSFPSCCQLIEIWLVRWPAPHV